MFSEKKVWGVEIYFDERKTGNYKTGPRPGYFWENKGHNLTTESYRRFAEEEHWEKNFVYRQNF